MKKLLLLLVLLIVPTQVFAAAPISGTFIVPDLFYTSVSDYRNFFQELHDTGINTVILTLPSVLLKNCVDGSYNEQVDARISTGNPPFFKTTLTLAKEFNMRVFYSLAEYMLAPCLIYHQGSATNEQTDKGRLIGMSMRTMDALKSLAAASGVSWSDPTIAGFYISPEENTRYLSEVTYPQLQFYRELSARIKQKEPTKKILYSPYQYEDVPYDMSKRAFENIYRETSIDIIAPQDSMGTGVTSTFPRSTEHFRALHDAASKYPGKEAWANIETFMNDPVNSANILPAPLTRITQQISTAAPFVSKMITWIYSYTMLSYPASDTMATKNVNAPYFTMANAQKRKDLRSAYMQYYQIPLKPIPTLVCTAKYYFNIRTQSCTKTSNTYTTDLLDCQGNYTPCTTNLRTYLPNQTTEQCFQTQADCEHRYPSPTKIAQSLPGDLTADGTISTADAQVIISAMGKTGPAGWINADTDSNGIVNIFDYNKLSQYYNKLYQ